MPPTIQLDHLSFSYDGKRDVLRDITVSLEGPGRIALVGANGIGKSTLLRLLVGFLPPHRGDVRINGLSLARENLSAIRAAIGYVFQDADSQLFLATVRDNVAFGPLNTGVSREETEERTDSALDQMGIRNLADERVYRLSGGQKRLASIATVLSMRPEIFLLDEPTSGLDPRNRRRLTELLRTLPGLLLIATHDLDFVRGLCDRVLLLADGGIAADGRPEAVLSDGALLEQAGL